MEIEKIVNGDEFTFKIKGELNIITSPELEKYIKENVEGSKHVIFDLDNGEELLADVSFIVKQIEKQIRKLICFLLGIFALSGGLISCGNNPATFQLTYNTAVNHLHSVDYSTLNNKINDKDINESFILLMYDSDSPSCSCWTLFRQFLLDTYIPETHTLFYVIGTKQFIGKNTFGINISVHQPSICFFNKTTLVKQIDYGNYPGVFTPSQGEIRDFRNLMNSYTTRQDKLYLYSSYEEVLDTDADKGEGICFKDKAIFYPFKTSCPDCKDAYCKVLTPYLNNISTLDTKIYLLDIDQYANKSEYQNIKNALELSASSNPYFGYGTGYVPTFQYREEGIIKDASIFYNDTIDKDGNNFIVSESFYSTDRYENISYGSDVAIKVLKGMSVDKAYVGEYEDEGETHYYWKSENAILYHKPLLESFLNKYAK